ncbi:MAG TPA: DNA-protecting protein DprA [Firmicutes bacterium]|jgi:DNA processing protein|nr:DNA-protecting protein DprA [Bacillota bacterium]
MGGGKDRLPKDRAHKAKYYHAFNLMPSLGPVRIRRLIRHFGSPEQAWEAANNIEALIQVKGFGRSLAEKVAKEHREINPEKSWAEFEQKGYSYIIWDDDNYPRLLREIYDPPPLLYYMGDFNVSDTSCLAIVGSRRHTAYGKEIAYKFASALSNYKITVVSGMARGIDTWAHKGVLSAGGKTLAVMGCGLDICYPPENRMLMEKIRQSGAVISEFPPGSEPYPQNFPRRNRIISGLSAGTIVVEAGERSGALITADFALEQGREVFAVPGGINSPYSRGCHRLIKEGAKLVEKVEDVLEELLLFSENDTISHKKVTAENGAEDRGQLNQDEIKLMEIIPYEPLPLEQIVIMSKMPISTVNILLLGLELKGIIKQLPGKYFVRN